MTLPPEIRRAEIIDWWEAGQERISTALQAGHLQLLERVDQQIATMSRKDLVAGRSRFRANTIDPLVAAWMEEIYSQLNEELDAALAASLKELDGPTTKDRMSYRDMAVAGAAVAASAAPLAGIPFFAGGLTVAGLTIAGFAITSGTILTAPVIAVVGTVVAVGVGPKIRSSAEKAVKNGFRQRVHREIEMRVMGDPGEESRPSLRGILLGELFSVTMKRMQNAA
ncbi:hypothetical protein ACEUZ9_002833 [Paracoccus litorisediminis]|uniref:hypothetical protein n=1 Tax=Paracoccus litorisediminis TaxID=2006130 RepID=UPI003730C467